MIKLMVPNIDKSELNLIKNVLNSGFITEGPITGTFEKKFSQYIKTKFAIATTSGTTALELALRVMNISNGDEVLLPSFSHPATGNCILTVRAKPKFVDIDLDTLNLSIKSLQKNITRKTKAVIVVSQFGNPVNMKQILKLKKKYNFHLIEDAACSTGSKIGNEKVGKQADITCFSFHPRKIITTGEGGMMVTNNSLFANKAQIIKNFGLQKINNKLSQIQWGTNLKLTDIQSAMGIVQLSKVEKIIKRRIQLAKNYSNLLESLEDNIILPSTMKGTRHPYQTYCILLKTRNLRDKLQNYLEKSNIETRIGTYALHLQPAFSEFSKTNLQNSEFAYKNGLALPLHHQISFKTQQYVVKQIQKFIDKK